MNWRVQKIAKVAMAASAIVMLAGCLPEDTYLSLAWSPDGQLLAVLSEKKGLVIADPTGLESRVLGGGAIDPGGISWSSDATRLAFASWAEGSLDMYVTSLDGLTTRVTSHPGRESHPMVLDDKLLYLTTESGSAELTSSTIGSTSSTKAIQLPQSEQAMLEPRISPTGRHIAWVSIENLRPRICVWDLQSASMETVTSESDVLNLLVNPVCWSPDGTSIGYLKKSPARADWADKLEERTQTGTELYSFNLQTSEPEKLLLHRPEGIRNPQFTTDQKFVFESASAIYNQPEGSAPARLPLDISARLPLPGGDDGQIAFIAADQLLGITSSSLERARILTFEMQDKFLLAEEYFRSGSQGKSYDLYEELAASVQRTRDPDMARFIYIANLRRLGRTDRAIAETEKYLREHSGADQPNKFLWRLLGFSNLLELGNTARAAENFERYRELTTDTLEWDEPESALNALEIIKATSEPVVQLYARAIKARLAGNFEETDRLFGDLLTTAPQLMAIQREYLKALEGFDHEVYYFSPTQRPFEPTKFQRAEYLQRLVNVVPDSPVAKGAKLDLFLLRIEDGSFSRARELLNEALSTGSEYGKPEGILEVFRNYLETPEPQPWINKAIPEVFLHADIRPKLEAALVSPDDRMLLSVVATKMALLQNDPDRARKEADGALAEWNKLEPGKQQGETAALYGRLFVMRGREAELRGLYSEAADLYMKSVDVLSQKQVDNFEFQEEIRYRAALLLELVNNDSPGLGLLREQEVQTGSELINPSWEIERLEQAIRRLVDNFDTTSGTRKLWQAYEAGVHFGKLRRNSQARAAYLLGTSADAPVFLRRKCIFELASLEELEGDPWNAARWYARLAALPEASPETRMWCSYQIARLHLSIGYKPVAAREALALIVTNRPETPLAIQAQELLVSTSTR